MGLPLSSSIVSASPQSTLRDSIKRTAFWQSSLNMVLHLCLYAFSHILKRRAWHSWALSGIMSTPYTLLIASTEYFSQSVSLLPYLLLTTASLRVTISARKLPSPHAGSKNLLSIRSVSSLTRSHIALTSRSFVNTSPRSCTRCLDFICDLFSTKLSPKNQYD